MASPIPTADGPLLLWLQNFCVKFPLHGGTLGFTAPQITAAADDCNMCIYLIQTYTPAMKNDAAEAQAYKDLIKNGPISGPALPPPMAAALPPPPTTVLPGTLPRLRALVQEIKSKPTYNDSIGADLGIIAPVPVPNMAPPVITATGTHATNVVLAWTKNGWSGVKVQGRPQGAALWEDLGQDNYSPYVDTRPLAAPGVPEIREYRMCHMDGDTPLLNWSDIAVVTVVP